MSPTLHIVMYPWFAFGHLTPFLRLANKLADRGHRISYILPRKAQEKLQTLNLHPDLIHFINIVVPHVDGLPIGVETTNEIPVHLVSHLATAMDLTQKDIEASLRDLKPDLVLFDVAYWIPALTTRLGIKSVYYAAISSVTYAYLLVPARWEEEQNDQIEIQFMQQPKGFPPSSVKLRLHEARLLAFFHGLDCGKGIKYQERKMIAFSECDAIAFRACREMEGRFCDYIASQYKKPVLLSGLILPDLPTDPLDERWDNWLLQFKEGSVVYCSFGSEVVLKKDQFQELLLGLELMGLPFFVASKPPEGAKTIEEALPEGFEGRVKGRGFVCGEWVQQQLILVHPSVGCFVTHCGFGSLLEGFLTKCQLVLLPRSGDQFVNSRLMAGDLKVGLEVEKRDEDGWFTRESLCKSVKLVMDENSQIGREVRANHTKLTELLLSEGFDSSYIDGLIKQLKDIVGKN